jgi:hypothetical protein
MSRIHGPRDIRTDIFIEVATFFFSLSAPYFYPVCFLAGIRKKNCFLLLSPSCFRMTFSSEKTMQVFLIQIFRFKELFLYHTVRVTLTPSQIGFWSRIAQIINKADIVMHVELPVHDILRIEKQPHSCA